MSKLTGAALDRVVANALGLKSVNNCEQWRRNMIDDDDDDTQVYQSQLLKKYTTHVPQYEIGWNAALDEAAARINNVRGFGQATQDSFAVFIKGLKKTI